MSETKTTPESTSYQMTENKKEIQNQGGIRCLKIKADPG